MATLPASTFLTTNAQITPMFPTTSLHQISPEYFVFKTVYWIELGYLDCIKSLFEMLDKVREEKSSNPAIRHGIGASTAPVLVPQIEEIINSYDKMYNRTPLYAACSKGVKNITKYLLDQGAKLDEVSGVGLVLYVVIFE